MTFDRVLKQVLSRSGANAGAGPAGFKRLMSRLGNPQDGYRIIHVAGTNGKGSVCHLCAKALQEGGFSTGLFISPHLFSVQERISINGQNISKRDFARLCQRVLEKEETPLNFFEIITAAAFLYFHEKNVQYAVLETGLGGRKDPTNVCLPVASVITSIGLDHCQWLGHTLGQIAYEKAGIIKPNTDVFCPPLPQEALREIKQKALAQKAPLHIIPAGPFSAGKTDWSHGRLILRKGGQRWPLHLLGEKQTQNACLVYSVCKKLALQDSAIKKAFACVQVPCRFEVLRRETKRIIFDGAHNPQAVQGLMDFFARSPWADNAALVCGFMKDKDYPSMLRLLLAHFKEVYITLPPSARAASLQEIKTALHKIINSDGNGAKIFFYARPYQALQAAQKACKTVLVTGSFYLAAYLRARKGLTEKSDCD